MFAAVHGPAGFTVDGLVRALIGIALFAGAYLAEVIRGGLQAIPRGQGEAASALGLSWSKTTALIVMRRRCVTSFPASSTASSRCSRTPRWY